MPTPDPKFDTRLLRHHLRRGVVDPKEIDKHLESLPDDAAHAVETDVRFESNRGRTN